MTTSLSYANVNSGNLAYAIGWLNWGNMTFTPGMPTTILSYSLPNEANLSFQLDVSGDATATATALPTWSGAAMGVLGYTGITGNCAVYMSGLNQSVSLNISNIQIIDKYNNIIPNFSFYCTDAEATNNLGEKIIFTADTIINQVDIYPPNYPCPPAVGDGSYAITIGGPCSGAGYNSRIFQANGATLLSPTLYTNGGAQALAVGFSLQQIILQKNISNRIDQSDQFNLILSTSVLDLTTITSGILTGTQPETVYNYGAIGDIYTINETMAPGSVSSLSQYVQTISIVNTSGGPIPAGINLGGTLPLNAGDYLLVTIKNTPIIPYIKPVKSAPNYSFQGNSISYTIVLANTSPNQATNVVLLDTQPNGTTFIPNSVYINGIQTNNSLPYIAVGTIPANSVTTVTFDVSVDTGLPKISPISNSSKLSYSYSLVGTVPNLEYLSNVVQTTILDNANLVGTKYVNATTGKFGDILTYTIVYKNVGLISANTLSFIDTLPIGTLFIDNSVKINGVAKDGINPEYPGFGITLPSIIGSNESITISFNVMIDTIANPTVLTNSGEMSYLYTPVTTPFSGVSDTNTVATTVNYIDISITKNVDKTFSYNGDTLTYSITINSIGNATASNIVFVDTIPSSLSLIPSSILYDNVPIAGDIISGINLNTITGITTHTIQFQVQIL